MDDRSLPCILGTLALAGALLTGCQQQAIPPPVATTPLRAVETPPPAYPAELACADVGGQVVIRLTIGAEGRPTQYQVVESSRQPALDASALEAVKTWQFEPATRAGQPVVSHLNVPVTFTPPVEKPDTCFALEDQQRRQSEQ